jgi:hypothetical protein
MAWARVADAGDAAAEVFKSRLKNKADAAQNEQQGSGPANRPNTVSNQVSSPALGPLQF